jgi:hypothetical protein
MNKDVPVLIVVFNRPEKTWVLIDALREVRPENVFIAADGPRVNRPNDAAKCSAVRQAVMDIDWECRVKTRFHENNLGCDVNVPDAIEWFFEHVEYGIILEDDGIPHPDYFSFCDVLFRLYENDNRIMQISSIAPSPLRSIDDSYHFSRTFRCGGAWGTWRRAWKLYPDSIDQFNDTDALEMMRSFVSDPLNLKNRYIRYIEFKRGQRTNWDFLWNMTCYSQNGLCIVPEVNLSKNIGFDAQATHTTALNPFFSNLASGPLRLPLTHPRFIFADSRPEESLDRELFKTLTLRSRLGWVYRQAVQFLISLGTYPILKK